MEEAETVTANVRISNRLGLHARASAKFCKLADSWDASVKVTKDGYTVRGDSVLDLLMLVAHQGSEIEIKATGPQAKEAVHALTRLVEENFGEED